MRPPGGGFETFLARANGSKASGFIAERLKMGSASYLSALLASVNSKLRPHASIESCRRRGLDPHAYLRDILTRLPHLTNWQLKDITPEAWAKAQRRPPLQAAS